MDCNVLVLAQMPPLVPLVYLLVLQVNFLIHCSKEEQNKRFQKLEELVLRKQLKGLQKT